MICITPSPSADGELNLFYLPKTLIKIIAKVQKIKGNYEDELA